MRTRENLETVIFKVEFGKAIHQIKTLIGQLIFKSACIHSVPLAGRRNSKRVMSRLRHHGRFRVFNKLKTS